MVAKRSIYASNIAPTRRPSICGCQSSTASALSKKSESRTSTLASSCLQPSTVMKICTEPFKPERTVICSRICYDERGKTRSQSHRSETSCDGTMAESGIAGETWACKNKPNERFMTDNQIEVEDRA